MAGFMDKMKDNAGDTRSRFEDLKQKEREGNLGEEGKAELGRLRERFSNHE